jgi:hypothetical protein
MRGSVCSRLMKSRTQVEQVPAFIASREQRAQSGRLQRLQRVTELRRSRNASAPRTGSPSQAVALERAEQASRAAGEGATGLGSSAPEERERAALDQHRVHARALGRQVGSPARHRRAAAAKAPLLRAERAAVGLRQVEHDRRGLRRSARVERGDGLGRLPGQARDRAD